MAGQTRRQNLYFPADMLGELHQEAKRQDRPISWLVQQAWRIARSELKKIPSTTDYLPNPEEAPMEPPFGDDERR